MLGTGMMVCGIPLVVTMAAKARSEASGAPWGRGAIAVLIMTAIVFVAGRVGWL